MNTHLEYIEWRDPKGLHEDTRQSISDLTFLKDELQFLKNLVAEHTLKLIYEIRYIDSKAIFKQLTDHTKQIEKLLKELKEHSNNLEIVLDDDEENVLGEIREYKNEHYRLIISEMNFHSDVKKTKRAIFQILSEINKKGKQKKLS
ncbi:hypothetical protein [Rasiella sp. SM2506]|uniref:hypothetical protein n=1 Tax=Rasiella sp. SM2506 TaxID=3423914 RepID=UPI003D7A8143